VSADSIASDTIVRRRRVGIGERLVPEVDR
jgi:hypothetical protein